MNLVIQIDKLDLADKSHLHVNDAHTVNVDQYVRRGNEQEITFHEDVKKKDRVDILEANRYGTRQELADHYKRRGDMKKKKEYT